MNEISDIVNVIGVKNQIMINPVLTLFLLSETEEVIIFTSLWYEWRCLIMCWLRSGGFFRRAVFRFSVSKNFLIKLLIK